jgi:hypothetical protein
MTLTIALSTVNDCVMFGDNCSFHRGTTLLHLPLFSPSDQVQILLVS